MLLPPSPSQATLANAQPTGYLHSCALIVHTLKKKNVEGPPLLYFDRPMTSSSRSPENDDDKHRKWFFLPLCNPTLQVFEGWEEKEEGGRVEERREEEISTVSWVEGGQGRGGGEEGKYSRKKIDSVFVF